MKIKIFVDTEGDFYKYIPSPHFSRIDYWKWKANKVAGKFRYPKSGEGLKNIVESFKKYKIPATFCICGHLYLKTCNRTHTLETSPKNSWYNKFIGKNWYYWDKNSKMCFGNFIEREMQVPYFTFGLHGFSHEAMTLERKEVVEKIIKSGINAAIELGIKIESFAAPFNMIEDINEKEKIFDALRKYKIKETQYAGVENGLKSKHGFGYKTKTDKGLKKWAIKAALDGTDSYSKIKKTIEGLKKIKEKKVLMIHDFTWKKDKAEFLARLLQ